MRAGAGLHADPARGQFRKKSQKRRAAQLPAQHDLTRLIHPVKLENGLGQIDPECCNPHVDGSFLLLATTFPNMAHRDAAGGAVHTIRLTKCRQTSVIRAR